MRAFFAVAVFTCTFGYLSSESTSADAAEITDLASSFEKGKPFGFKLDVKYSYSYKTAHLTRESVPSLQTQTTRDYLANHLGLPAGQAIETTEIVPDLLYTQRRHTMAIDLAIGLFRELELGVSLPLVLRDERQYDLDRNAGFNTCGDGNWSCIAGASSTYLDGIYAFSPSGQSSSLLFAGPVRGGSGTSMLDTINLSLTGAVVSQRRDPSKPTWTLGFEADVSIGDIMAYDNTRAYLAGRSEPSAQALIAKSAALGPAEQGFSGVSDGLHRFIFKTAVSHRFKYVDPYLGLYYLLPLPRTFSAEGSPWQTDYGFALKHPAPQHQAGITFGFEVTPYENKEKGHRIALDFRAGLQFHFLGRGYSEAWELLASSSALVCDDQTPLPGTFNYTDPRGPGGAITQGYFNPACRAPDQNGVTNGAYPRLPANANAATAAYQRPYSGLTLIENYMTFQADLGVVIELFRHARLRLAVDYMRDQGHVLTQDDAGTTSYPDNNRLELNNPLNATPGNTGRGCDPARVDLKCPYDWNPTYRAAINLPGRRYRVDDVNVISGSAMLQAYF